MISIIMPSYLGAYKKSARDREHKLSRAIRSVIKQEYTDWQLVVVADGCPLTVEMVKEIAHPQIRLVIIDKQRMWGGAVRNVGIENAEGDWICYLDNDDFLHPCHLFEIDAQAGDNDWLFFNDYIYNGKIFIERTCWIEKFQCGTANIAHRRGLPVRWKEETAYGLDDWNFIQALRNTSENYKKISGPAYLVCHIPNRYDI